MSDPDYEAEAKRRDEEREARWRRENRLKLASAIFRDLVMVYAKARAEARGDGPLDMRGLACESVEGTDELLRMLDLPTANATATVLPPYEP